MKILILIKVISLFLFSYTSLITHAQHFDCKTPELLKLQKNYLESDENSSFRISSVQEPHANTSHKYIEMDNLVIVYENTNKGALPDEINSELEMPLDIVSEFFFRNSHMRFLPKWKVIYINEYIDLFPDINSNQIPPHIIDTDLRNRNLPLDVYDNVYIIAQGSGNWAWGVNRVLGKGAYMQTGWWGIQYEIGVVIHEFNHIIDAMFLYIGYHEYPMNHPGEARARGEFIPSLGHLDAGIARHIPDERWLTLAASQWGELKTADDLDDDHVPDYDANLPIHEVFLHGSSNSNDTDNDGLNDFDEVLAGIHKGSLLNHIDTDRDGIHDGEDKHPLYPVKETTKYRTSSINDLFENWQLNGMYFDFHTEDNDKTELRTVFDDKYLYLGFKFGNVDTGDVVLDIDGNSDGNFNGSDNYEIRFNRYGISDVLFKDANIVTGDDWTISDLPISLFPFKSSVKSDGIYCQIAIPKDELKGISLSSKERIGIRLKVYGYGNTWKGYDWGASMFELEDYFYLELENVLVVNAKGSEARGVYAHFKILVDGQEIGDSFTTSEYEPYIFPLSIEPSSIQAVHIVFDNDLYTVEEDRNLYVKSISVGDEATIEATAETVTYITSKGEELEYNGMMQSNGALIFDVEKVPGVCKGDITLSTQAEVDACPCSEIQGSLTIKGDDIVNLDGLSELTSIGGGLEIDNNSNLIDIKGLSSLKTIQWDLIIIQNILLKNLNGLENLEEIGGYLGIMDCESLETIDGISNLKIVGYGFEIENNHSLKIINGFNELVSLGGTLSVSHNRDLKTINGFNSIVKPYEIYIGSNVILEKIEGFNSIVECTYVSIYNNAKLKNIIGFESLKVLSGFDKGVFNIHDNPELVIIDCIRALDQGTVVIERNNKLKDIFGPATKPYEISISLRISNNIALEHVDGLKSLTKASLNLNNNAALENLDGLVNLNEAMLTIEDNPSLVSFCGLYPVFYEGGVRSWSFNNNGIEITKEEILANGPCIGNELVIEAKGTEVQGIFPHFQVMVNGNAIGESNTTIEYNLYRFMLPAHPDSVQIIEIAYDNDTVIEEEDIDLFIKSIGFGDSIYQLENLDILYLDEDGYELDYNDVMTLNGTIVLYFTAPEPPKTNDISLCENDSLISLNALGKNIKWYAEASLLKLLHEGNEYQPNLSGPRTYNYYLTQTLNSFESKPATLQLIIRENPGMPKVNNVTYCEGELIADLIATGNDIRWYKNMELTEFVSAGNRLKVESTPPGVYNYYPTQTISGCESDPSILTLKINEKPPQPLCDDAIFCENDQNIGLKATGDSIHWYDDSAMSNLIKIGNDFTPKTILPGTSYYYLTQIISACESAVDSVQLVISKNPVPPLSENIRVCFGEDIPDLVALGTDIKWYEDGNLESLLKTGETLDHNRELVGEYIYFVTQTIEKCESRPDTLFLVIHNLPEIDLGRDTTIGFEAELTIGVPDDFASYAWNSGSTSNYLDLDGETLGVGEHLFSLSVLDTNSCTSSDSIIVTVSLPTGLDEYQTDEFVKIYPIPSSQFIFVSFKEDFNTDCQVVIYDLAGRTILWRLLENFENHQIQKIDISQLNAGLYVLGIYSLNHDSYLKQIVIE